jgi:O-antigen/teichoic acid export membrane protein
MIRIDTGFYIFDRPIITLFYKKKYAVKIRLSRLICVLMSIIATQVVFVVK